MKLQTSIKPRRDGTVRVVGLNGETYVFERDNEGEMSADVPHDATVAHLLDGGLFWPADEEDHSKALSLASLPAGAGPTGDGPTGDGGSTTPPVTAVATTPAPAPASEPQRAKPGPKPKTPSATTAKKPPASPTGDGGSTTANG